MVYPSVSQPDIKQMATTKVNSDYSEDLSRPSKTSLFRRLPIADEYSTSNGGQFLFCATVGNNQQVVMSMARAKLMLLRFYRVAEPQK